MGSLLRFQRHPLRSSHFLFLAYLRGHSICCSATRCINDQLMRVVINMDILAEYHDFFLIAEQRCYFFQRHALCLWNVQPYPDNTKAGDDDEDLSVSRYQRTSTKNILAE